ncbi:MAG: hypothetical protein QXY45_01745 [Candidatus Aenigmatarchaeota archaeon]
MKMFDLFPILREMKLNEKKLIYTSRGGTKVYAIRTDKICPHDFAVELLTSEGKKFRPTHVRLLFDLYLKKISNKKDAEKLFFILEKIYRGDDPEKYSNDVLCLKFPMKLDDADVNLYYTQLLMIEQEFNYGIHGCKKGKVEPPREFLMRFIRWVASGENEIDKVITNAVRNWPPPLKYSRISNK